MTQINENKFRFMGIDFVSQKQNDCSCNGCFFKDKDCDNIITDKSIPPCNKSARLDRENVIFIKTKKNNGKLL